MANYTGDEIPTDGRASSLPVLPAGLAIFYAALNIILSITASLGNALILVALRQVSSVHPPTKLLFRCLAVTDLLVGLVLQPLYAAIILNAVTKTNAKIVFNMLEAKFALSFLLCGVSVFTSTAISVDRLLALMLRLRYRQVLSLRRVNVTIICFWLIGVSVGITYLVHSYHIAFIAVVALLTLCLVISVFCYTRIFLTLRQRHAQVNDNAQPEQENTGIIPLNIARYKKSVSSIAWVQLALVACYVPYAISVIIIKINGWRGINADICWISTKTLVYVNSSLNPILYCWRIREVRQTVKDTVQFYFSFPS